MQSNEGWHRHTIAGHFPDGQNDNNYNHGQLVCGSTNGENTTKFKNEENQKVGLNENLPARVLEGTPTEPRDGWCRN